ncbi:hypothetical protein CI238_10801, partial [Colletotrichum incanum]
LLKSIYVVKTFLLTTLTIPSSSASFTSITSIYLLRCPKSLLFSSNFKTFKAKQNERRDKEDKEDKEEEDYKGLKPLRSSVVFRRALTKSPLFTALIILYPYFSFNYLKEV